MSEVNVQIEELNKRRKKFPLRSRVKRTGRVRLCSTLKSVYGGLPSDDGGYPPYDGDGYRPHLNLYRTCH